MTGGLNILIFNTILLVFHLTHSQPITLKRIWATANDHCRTSNNSLVNLINLNNSGASSTDLLIIRIWSSVDGKYTPWIAYKGCFEIEIIPAGLIQNANHIVENTVEKCYLECQKENISCERNEPLYFARKGPVCVCICKIQEFLLHSNKCNEPCYSNNECNTDNLFNVYTKYVPENTKPDGFCLLCSKADLNSYMQLGAFGCDELFGLCAEREDICYGIKENNGNLIYSKFNCTQQIPLVCLIDDNTEKPHQHEHALLPHKAFVFIVGASSTIIATSVLIFFLFYLRKMFRRRNVHAKLHEEHKIYEHLKIHSEGLTPGQSNEVYHIKVSTTGNNCNPEANHYYDSIQQSGRENDYHYENVV